MPVRKCQEGGGGVDDIADSVRNDQQGDELSWLPFHFWLLACSSGELLSSLGVITRVYCGTRRFYGD